MFMSAIGTTDHPKQDWRNLSPVSKTRPEIWFSSKDFLFRKKQQDEVFNNKLFEYIYNLFHLFIKAESHCSNENTL